jgi:glycosyltransferase involved in cell wall biosynthesis
MASTVPGEGADAAADTSPLLSVVIPTFRSAVVLPAALDSLAAQQWRGFEVVLSDGASDDGTLEIARAWADRLPALRVDSRPDAGVYDAINRGVSLARGEWILVLGSDDRLHAPDTLARAAAALRASVAEVVYGDVRMMQDSADGVAAGDRYAGPMPLVRLLRANICQQSMFYRRRLLERLGGFDQRYRIWADWALNLRAAFEQPMQWIDLVVADYAATGLSATRSDPVLQQELPELIRREFAARAGQPGVRAASRHLLRQADALRRRGRWREAGRQLATWLRVQLG